MASSLRIRTARVEIATLRVDDRVKEGKGGGGREKKIALNFLFFPPGAHNPWAPVPAHSSLPFTCPFPPLFGVSWRFLEQQHSRARRKRLNCRLLKDLLAYSCKSHAKIAMSDMGAVSP